MTGVNELRESFLSFFEGEGHQRRASAPLVPDSDPSLLFVNAGMVPFKNIFTGAETSPAARVTSSQKCLRAGGKHNDLDNVGYTARHHTFFEMLGNFSFGDYFKEDAISLAWRFVTEELGLDANRLLVTIYAEDEDAGRLWKSIASLGDDRIIPIATSDNFWSMGDTGPCGPCSEIFYDHGPSIAGGPPGSPDEDGDRFIEIWNLVFMQFDQAADGSRRALPKPSIDTGMGLERIAAVLQGVHNNYEIDLFSRLISASEDVFNTRAEGEKLASFRVIADHLRAGAFLLADGVSPSNEGRGYVLRRIMRRSMRHAHVLGAREPSMFRLVDPLIEEMGQAFPELVRARAAIIAEFEQEEGRFQRTLGRGLSLLEEAAQGLGRGDRLPGETAFKLYDTFGFPLDLTQDILRTRDISVDTDAFSTAMERQREGSRSAWSGSGDAGAQAIWFDLADAHGETQFEGYDDLESSSILQAIIVDGDTISGLTGGSAALVFEASPFYAESGGQAGDHGEVVFESGARFIVRDVQKKAGRLHVHYGELQSGEIEIGAPALLRVDGQRRARIMANHSATHLMHAALRNVLGEHVSQKGSLVEEDRLRFDFSHGGPLSDAEIEAVEDEVNAVIRQNAAVAISLSSPDAAIEAGALALFGEKYGDEVRVLTMGTAVDDRPGRGPNNAYSVELCGGTHVARTGDIATFVILSEQGVSAGIRRIEAATGAEALAFLKGQAQVARDLGAVLKVPLKDLPGRVGSLIEERRALERELGDVKRKLAMSGSGEGAGGASTGPEEIGGIKFVGRIAEGIGGKDLRTLVDEAKAELGSGVVVFVGVNDGKAAVSVGVTDDLTAQLSAVDLVRVASQAVGGKGGGGRADMAQAGGPDGDKAEDALAAVRAALAS
jgi:alanyl-tRNA synthetase